MSTNEPPLGPDPERPDGPVPPPPPQPPSDGPAYPPPPGDAPGYGGSAYPPPPGGGGYGGYPPPPGGGSGFVEPFSAPDAIGYGWRKLTANLGPWLVLGLIALALMAIFFIAIFFSSVGVALAGDESSFGGLLVFFLMGFALTVALSILNAVAVRGALDATEGRAFDLGNALGRIDLAPVIVLSVILALIGNLGSLLPGFLGAILSLVGFVLTFLTYFAMTFLVDRGLSPVDSLKASIDLVRANLGNSILLALLSFVVILIGACPCGLLLFLAYPVVAIASAYAYKKFQDQPVAA
ncbi:hypothetical protein IDH50_15265 [Aeromicrobium tamlense]|uniref:Membrane protein n=1 Tax=Aeromicrobium tamlense TaxID=375541 RepID=A0A8I0G128_9ACTN|nr:MULTISPECIES: hypothetical protein [Aeromicrobium]MBD1271602.1 hypothetical protein [Aeromicrobium tamlense]NYI37652.1 putative membrane protein [Aeromicrobium tamlense]